MFPSIEPGEVGNTGLLWLFLSYGFVLFKASDLISGGSELLLLVPSLAGLVGGVVLPLLGAVPDGAIIAFSGFGDKETVQETLSVGVGALAGSTIMLLTIPFALSIFAGRVDIVPSETDGKLQPRYNNRPKLSQNQPLSKSGVVITEEIKHAGLIMLLTTIPYWLIQVPALFIHGTNEEVAKGESMYALTALVICLVGFVWYLRIHVKASQDDEDKFHRMEKIKDMLLNGSVSLSGALVNVVETFDGTAPRENNDSEYQAISSMHSNRASIQTNAYLKNVLSIPFKKYDKDSSGGLQKQEFAIFLRDFNESLTTAESDALFDKYDQDNSGVINFEEFVSACHAIIISSRSRQPSGQSVADKLEHQFSKSAFQTSNADDDEEEEEVPEEIAALPADQQQSAIKKKAFTMLGIGTFLVLLFSDPMVDVMQEIATRVNISPFYVSFALAPLAANASEVLASHFYASKKTTKTITVSFSALLGAAAMNNTFCLSIFMGIIYFRGLAWEFTAETIVIISCQIFMFLMTKSDYLTAKQGLLILFFFPFSIALVAIMEMYGFD